MQDIECRKLALQEEEGFGVDGVEGIHGCHVDVGQPRGTPRRLPPGKMTNCTHDAQLTSASQWHVTGVRQRQNRPHVERTSCFATDLAGLYILLVCNDTTSYLKLV